MPNGDDDYYDDVGDKRVKKYAHGVIGV